MLRLNARGAIAVFSWAKGIGLLAALNGTREPEITYWTGVPVDLEQSPCRPDRRARPIDACRLPRCLI